jgi:lysophospholipase L1-like esterase
MDRRTLLKLGSGVVAATALGMGGFVESRRMADRRVSERVTGPWPELGPSANWVLPDLHRAYMVVPDRPHRIEEARDKDLRAKIRRTRSFHVSSGPKRLRGVDFSEKPAPGVFRILAVGDSITFGWGVDEDETWPLRLGKVLESRNRKVEVLNAGVPASPVDTMASWLVRMAPAYGAKGVIFCRRPDFRMPNPFEGYARSVSQCRLALPDARFFILLPPISRFDPFGTSQGPTERQQLASLLPDLPVLDLTDSFRKAQGDRGCTLVQEGGRMKVVRLETGETLVDAAAAERDLPQEFYDLFERDHTVRESLFFDSGHPNAPGHEIFAGLVADAIEAAGWFA